MLVANGVVVVLRVLLHHKQSDRVAAVTSIGWDRFAAGIAPFLVAGLVGLEDDLSDLWHLTVQCLPQAAQAHAELHVALKGTVVYPTWQAAAAVGAAAEGGVQSAECEEEGALPHPSVAVAESLMQLMQL